MAFKGHGVARVNGRVLFIPYAVKGDEAWVEIVQEKKDYLVGRVKTVPTPSPWRVNPPCPYFGRCGGCQWQHIDPSVQGEIKRDILQETLKRLAGLYETPSTKVFPSPQPYGYRIKIQLKGQGGKIGYFQEKSHQLVDIDQCLIAHPLVNDMLASIREESSVFSEMKQIEINVSPEEGQGILILRPSATHRRTEIFLSDFLRRQKILKGMAIVSNGKFKRLGQTDLTFTISFDRQGETKQLKLRVSPESFFQVHPEQNRRLIQTVLDLGNPKEEEKVLDLYCGVGNLTLPLALNARETLGIEEVRAAVDDARFNAEVNGIEGCDFIGATVEEGLKDSRVVKPDLLVLDPPRTGSKRTMDQIAGLAPKRIVYVSCDPTTFARDLHFLAERGYSLRGLSLIDLFPQTYHMEVVASLRKD